MRTRPTRSTRSTHTRRQSRVAYRATQAGDCNSGSGSRSAPARCGTSGSAARGSGLRAYPPGQRLVHDALDERVVLEPRLCRSFRHLVLGGNEGVGIHLEDIDLVVVRQTHVNTAVVLKPQRVEGGAADLADTLGQLVRDAFSEHVPDLLTFAVVLVPFRFVGRDAVLGRLGLAEGHFRQRQDLDVSVADQTDVHLASLNQLLDDRRLVELRVNELDSLLQARVILYDRGLGDADQRVLEQWLDDEWKAQLGRAHQLVAIVKLGERRHADAVIGVNLLGQRLVVRDEQ